jgi:hypothetical protein
MEIYYREMLTLYGDFQVSPASSTFPLLLFLACCEIIIFLCLKNKQVHLVRDRDMETQES